MSLKNYLYFGWALLLMALLFIGFTCGRQSVRCPPTPAAKPCPQIVAVACTVVKHDTIRRYIPTERIIYRTVPSPAAGHTEQCLSVEDTSNGAYARMTFCSRELPVERPADLRGTLELVLPPDTTRAYEYLRVDTVRVMVPTSKRWALTVGTHAGYGLRGLDAGVGLAIGLKLKEW